MTRIYNKLNQNEILQLLEDKKYIVDFDIGVVYGRGRKELYTKKDNETDGESPYLSVELYSKNRRCRIAVHRLVWMAVTGLVIPEDFIVHHIDKNTINNSWYNLLCLHTLDHDKIHCDDTEEITF